MSTAYGDTRWWENYAVRYLMPSVAGMAIVKWICWHGGNKLIPLLNLPLEVRAPGVGFETASLILLFLYGNLFCYVASYPILVFHATRVMDFENDRWKHRIPRDGYIATGLLVVLAFVVAHFFPDHRRFWAFVFAGAFSLIQVWRVWFVFSAREVVKSCRGVHGEHGGDVTLLYFYNLRMSMRRGRREKTVEKDGREIIITDVADSEDDDDDDDRVRTRLGEELWHKEYMETYRHLREHGNSAFIFVLELVLATLIYCITTPDENAVKQLSAIGILFAVWAFPAVSAHLIGQYLERRFSHVDRYWP
jgi:hypothetical protein